MSNTKPSTPVGPTQGARQEFKRTGKEPNPSNSGANSKVTTPKTY